MRRGLFLVGITHVWADLPVHCDLKNLGGTWVFKYTPAYLGFDGVHSNAYIPAFRGDPFCFHRAPNSVADNLLTEEVPEYTEKFQVHLSMEAIPKGTKRVLPVRGDYQGEWTPVADMGLNVDLHDGPIFRSFLAFHKFECPEGTSFESCAVDRINPQGVTQFTKYQCDATFGGWYVERQGLTYKYGCFQAFKLKKKTQASFLELGNSGKVRHFRQLMLQPQEQNACDFDADQYPANVPAFDWDAGPTTAWTTPVIQQGNCGNCYAHAMYYVFERKVNLIRQHFNISGKLEFEVAELTPASYYSQGCEGGYGYLVGRDFRDIGVPATCKVSDQSCVKDQQNLWYAREVGYASGFSGGCSPNAVAEEILADGPVSAGLEVFREFGKKTFVKLKDRNIHDDVEKPFQIRWKHPNCLPDDSAEEVQARINAACRGLLLDRFHMTNSTGQFMAPFAYALRPIKKPLMVVVQECLEKALDCSVSSVRSVSYMIHDWEYTNHAVVMVGYDEKHWIIRNSWGNAFGTNGYTYIERGRDFAGIESEVEFLRIDWRRGAGYQFWLANSHLFSLEDLEKGLRHILCGGRRKSPLCLQNPNQVSNQVFS